MAPRIMVVEDELSVAEDIRNKLTNLGYIVHAVVFSAGEAIQKIAEAQPDLVLLDSTLDGAIDRVEVTRQICEHFDIPVIYLTACAYEAALQQDKANNLPDYILEPFEERELHISIEATLCKHKLEREIALLSTELQARNEELDAFAHTIAHSLSNPLGIINGYIGVLEGNYAELSDAERRKYLHKVARSGRRMNNIVKELFLLSGVHKIEADLSPLDMASIVAEAQQNLTDIIEEHYAEIVLPDTWPVAVGYAPWIEEVWINYISNAIKYGGQPPRLELGATVQSDDAAGGRPMVRFWVRDNGPGIAPEDQAKLFTPFTRLDQVRAKGYGLGLSIVQRIIERLDGQVGVESKIGQGSVFSFTLPGA